MPLPHTARLGITSMASAPPRIAAVLLLLFQRDGEDHIVLTRRTDAVATHKGQISLPGGMREDGDESLLQTALRETREELGIDTSQVEVLGQLAEVPTVVSNFLVTPFVARLAGPPAYRPHPGEVAEVIEVPLSALRNPDNFWEEETERAGERWKAYFFRYGEHIIWGATARILKHYLDTTPS